MGGQAEGLNLAGKPAVILMAGLQGSGKTLQCEIGQLPKEQENEKAAISCL